MKTKLLALALSAVILLCGCSKSAESGTTAASEITAAAIVTETEAVTAAPEKAQLSDYTQPVSGNDELRSIIQLSFLPTDITNCENGMLAASSVYDGKLCVALINTLDGTVTENSPEIPDIGDESYCNSYFVNGFLVFYDTYSSSVFTLDDELNLIDSCSIGREYYGGGAVTSGSRLLVCGYSATELYAFDIGSDGKITLTKHNVPLNESTVVQYVIGVLSENEILLAMFDNETFASSTAVYSLDDNTMTKLSIPQNEFAYVIGGKIVTTNANACTVSVFDPSRPNIKSVFSIPAGTGIITGKYDSDNIYFYSQSTDSSALTLLRYSAESGCCTAKTEIPAGVDSWIFTAAESDGNVYLQGYIDNVSGVYVWTPTSITESSYGFDMLSSKDYDALNSELVKKMLNEYSVNVFYGKDGVKFFSGYAVVTETDAQLINQTLTSLDAFFGRLPKGFTQEIISSSEDIDALQIYLTGKIIPDNGSSESISDASAFASQIGSAQTIVMDITCANITVTTAHEFMHIIENTMNLKAWARDYSEQQYECFARWFMLNPDDFNYYMTYTDENGSTMGYDVTEGVGSAYYEGSGIDLNSIYFVDGYSMTYPCEDYARIFENLATCTRETLPAYFAGEHIQLKAAYLCACIRECFDCITDDTTVYWESAINPDYNLQYFKDNYDLDAYFLQSAVG